MVVSAKNARLPTKKYGRFLVYSRNYSCAKRITGIGGCDGSGGTKTFAGQILYRRALLSDRSKIFHLWISPFLARPGLRRRMTYVFERNRAWSSVISRRSFSKKRLIASGDNFFCYFGLQDYTRQFRSAPPKFDFKVTRKPLQPKQTPKWKTVWPTSSTYLGASPKALIN